jgi:hypothetical protein
MEVEAQGRPCYLRSVGVVAVAGSELQHEQGLLEFRFSWI